MPSSGWLAKWEHVLRYCDAAAVRGFPLTDSEAALRDLLAEQEWRDIATAPGDGTPVLGCSDGPWLEVWSIGLAPQTVRFRTYHPNQPGKACWRNEDGRPVYPTLWLPLPATPEVGT